ncbi:unnamed protein product [Mytilus edulis]|uniref:Integrase catalytic domain-containing protein n=1 Tax=Mytilus edulis TaxID=6550 RepID=A0A8S3Q8L3_MYTED|nr:unnamed protein product [Mytilus edulis]
MLGLDLVGPLHTTDNNNRFIAVLTDYFTKWPEVKAIPSKHSHHIAEFIIEVICRHGTPSEVITDRGREFCNKVNSILCSKLNIDHKVSSPYHPQTNGLTERFNQTLCNSLRKYVNDQQNDWDQYLQQVAFAARTCVQKSTKQTPFFLVYGRKPTLPIELDIPTAMPSDNSDEVELNDRIMSFVHLIKTQKDTKEEIKKAQTKQKEYHDRNHQKPFLPGEQVLVKNSKRINRCGDKMVHRWTGPFTIADYIGKGVYKVNGRKTVLNAKSLRRYLTPKPTAKSQKPTAKSQKPSAKSQTAKIQKPLKQLKTLSSNVKLHHARKTSNQPTSISKETALNDFERWLTLLPNSSLEFIVDKCSNYNMTNPRDILHFTAASLECPRLSMYLKWQKNTPSDLDQCITTLVERLKPHPLRKLPNPVKRVPAIMITAAVLLEAYSTTSKPEDVLLTLEDVPLGYSVESQVLLFQDQDQTTPSCCWTCFDYS